MRVRSLRGQESSTRKVRMGVGTLSDGGGYM